MFKKLKAWKTCTRHKFLAGILVFIGICIIITYIGWFRGVPGAPEMLTALIGTGGLTTIFIGFSVAWEKAKRDKGGTNV